MRVERHGSLHPCVLDRSDGAVQVRADLVVDVHRVHTEGGKLSDELYRLDDHQMHIQGLLDHGAYGLENREPKGNIGYEDPIHHVDM